MPEAPLDTEDDGLAQKNRPVEEQVEDEAQPEEEESAESNEEEKDALEVVRTNSDKAAEDVFKAPEPEEEK